MMVRFGVPEGGVKCGKEMVVLCSEGVVELFFTRWCALRVHTDLADWPRFFSSIVMIRGSLTPYH